MEGPDALLVYPDVNKPASVRGLLACDQGVVAVSSWCPVAQAKKFICTCGGATRTSGVVVELYIFHGEVQCTLAILNCIHSCCHKRRERLAIR